MQCKACEAQLAEAADLFTFIKGPKDIHFALKPERRAYIENKSLIKVRESRKKVRVKCKACLENVGVEVPFGPSGTCFVAFGLDKVVIFGFRFSAKRKWSEISGQFPQIERRNEDNFFGPKYPESVLEKKAGTQNRQDKPSVKFPTQMKDFEWYSLTPDKEARNYQIEAYIEALQRDLVVILDTGLGKTLIASMVIAKMKLLNPEHMGLMLVDRIPLVFQQGHAITTDTGLRVCCICGENRTERRVKQLHDGTFDVLVITAGSFFELLNRDQIEISNFSVIVFDECHHAAGGHVYTKILDQIASLPKTRRPRVLGLTASPVRVDNITKGRNKLRKFQAQFLNSCFYYPNTENLKTKPEQVTFSRDALQNSFVSEAIRLIQSNAILIKRIVAGYDISTISNTSHLYRLKGEIRAIQQEYIDRKDLQDIVKTVILLIDAIEICELIGVQYAVEILADTLQLPRDISEFKEKFADCCDIPPRLTKLEEILETCTPETRTIVFVRTQIGVEKLFGHLNNRFPDLQPRKMFGHGGFYGMSWDEEQRHVLREFKEGKTSLLISTSVLEEGLDVAECNLVIRYSGPNNLISYIQSRGRARSSSSRYFVFIEESQKRTVEDLENQESLLRFLINNEGSSFMLPTELSKRVKSHLQNERELSFVEPSRRVLPERQGNKSAATFQFFVRPRGEQELILNDELVEELEQFDNFKVQRIFVEERSAADASGTYGVFTSHDKALLVSLRSDFGDVLSAYEELCKTWDFRISSSRSQGQVWSRITNFKFPGDVQRQYLPVCVEFGRFNSKQIFEVSRVVCRVSDAMDPEDNIDMEYTVDSLEFISNKSVVIDFSFHATEILTVDLVMKIPLTELNSFALVSFTDNKPCLYLPLKSASELSHNCTLDGKFTRCVGSEYLLGIIAENPVIAITFEKGTWRTLHQTLSCPENLPVPVFDTRVIHDFALERKNVLHEVLIQLQANPSEQLVRSLWKLKVLTSKWDVCLPLEDIIYLYKNLVKAKEDPKILEIFEHSIDQVLSLCSECYWFDVKEAFKNTQKNVKQLPVDARVLIETSVPANHILIKRVVITPSRIICMPALPIASNRLLRYFCDKYEFIVVLFREEQFQKLQGTETLKRIKTVIKNGIMILKNYWFFCASASQIRDHKAYFVAADSYAEVEQLRKKIVENEDCFKSTAKYMSRLGLFCSADKPVCNISKRRISQEDDISALNGDKVTDGCGKISKSLAEKVTEELGIEDSHPSAFQIRLAGIKGVLVVAQEDDNDLEGYDIMYRDSMLKFKSSDEKLCVVSTAKYNNLYLNREVITLLTSINNAFINEADWPIENAITEMHETALCDAASIFEDTRSACIALMEYIPKKVLNQTVTSGYDILSEPFWFSLLQTVYRLAVSELRFKTRIPVENACLLMGVADPIGVLRDDEIFVQIKADENSPSKIITGRVLVYRNPCLHPGDLRWVTAVNHPELSQWENVVIMPTMYCFSSLAAQCSGGDLDGDEFAVIWDSRFIPPDLPPLKPLNYAALAQGSPEDYDTLRQIEVFAEFYTRIIANDTLGRVAHTHIALCDQLEKGACDQLAMELAESQSQAVDFPKTGIIPKVPSMALEMVQKKGYPDFMEKNDSYYSEKLLGKLYRRCRSLMFDFELSAERKRLSCDLDLVVNGNEAYLQDARERYDAYSIAFKALMVRFQLKRESEVILGRAIKWNTLLTADKGKVSKSIKASYDALVKKFREKFFSDVFTDDEIHKKASAWYRVTYDEKLQRLALKKPLLHSFAWIVGDILCTMKKDKQSSAIERPNLVLLGIGESIYQEFLRSRVRIESAISVKENVLRCITSEIKRVTGKDSFSVKPYGSVSIYLCEPESDLDVSVQPLRKAWEKWGPGGNLDQSSQSRHFLESVISRSLDKIANTKSHKLDAPVPVISITVGESSKSTSVDISMNIIGELKTRFIQSLYKSNPVVFPFMWILVRWARCVGLVKSAESSECLIATAEFYILVIHLMKLNDCETKNPKRPDYKVQELIEIAIESTEKHKVEIGDMLTTFFRRGAALDGEIELVWPSQEIPNVYLSGQTTKLISAYCMNGLHTILATRNASTMLSHVRDANTKQTEFSKKLSYTLSSAIGSAASFHSAMLSSVTGAKVDIQEEQGMRYLVLTASGTRTAIMKLKEELHDLSVTNRAMKLGRLPKKTSRYFMEGSTMLMTRESTSADTMVSFEKSMGPYNILHQLRERHCLKLNGEPEESWLEKAVQKLSNRIADQMRKFPVKNKSMLDSLRVSLVFGCFYTVEISTSLPPSQPAESIENLEQKIEKNRRNRKNWQRGEYTGSGNCPQESEGRAKYPTKELGPSKGVNSGGYQCMRPKDKGKKKRSTVTSAFCPGLLERNCSSSSTISACEKIFIESLMECGFEAGTNGYVRNKSPWKMHSVPSTSYEVIAQIDEDLRVTEVTERALKWVCANVVHGKTQSSNKDLMVNHDFRVNVVTKDPVLKDSKLYRTIVPNDESQLIRIKSGKPEFASDYPKENRTFTSMVSERKKVHTFKKKNFDAIVVSGVEYRGKDLAIGRKFCDVSLDFNPNIFKETLQQNIFSETFAPIAKEILQTAVQLSDVVSRKVNDL